MLLGLHGVEVAFVFGVDHPTDGQGQLRESLSSYKVARRIFSISAQDVQYLTSLKPDRRSLARLAERLAAEQ